ncbi:hypothetical protein BGZ68_005751 [Mortierella alpina]|nr:hypothetical protein BGZ68_005751 [Mortierella alpina]
MVQAPSPKRPYGGETSNPKRICRRRPSKRDLRITLTPFLQVDSEDYKYINYYGEISIGKPEQKFRVLFYNGDNGVVWVPNLNCDLTASDALANLNRYDGSISEMFMSVDNPSDWTTGYQGGLHVRGLYGNETLVLGSMELHSATFGRALYVSKEFGPFGVDGMFPLGPLFQVPETNVDTFMRTAIKEQVISNPEFSVYLPPDRSGLDATGEIVLGDIDSTRYTGDLTYVNTVSNTKWVIEIDDITSRGEILGKSGRAEVDMGESRVFVSRDVAEAIHLPIPGAKFEEWYWTVPCNLAQNTEHRVSFTIGGRAFHIPMADLPSKPPHEDDVDCASVIAISDDDEDEWSLGVPFIKNNYCVFDMDRTRGPRIGIAELRF